MTRNSNGSAISRVMQLPVSYSNSNYIITLGVSTDATSPGGQSWDDIIIESSKLPTEFKWGTAAAQITMILYMNYISIGY